MTLAGWLFIAFFALMAFVGLLAAVRAGAREDEARAMLAERLEADHTAHVTHASAQTTIAANLDRVLKEILG